TNTFGASRRKLGEDPAPYIEAGIALAKRAGAPYVALDIGPLGALMAPYGELSFEEAYEMFTEIILAGVKAGADLVLIETMSDLLEVKAALLAAKEHCDLPVFTTMTFGEDGRTFLGTDPRTAAITLTSLGADVVGINCSQGPEALRPALLEMIAGTHLPVMIQPNAGLPRLEDGKTVFDVGAEEFARWAGVFLDDGAAILGGCCGTTPAHIAAVKPLLADHSPIVRGKSSAACFCGWQGHAALTLDSIASVGERINPTGRKKLKEALYSKNWDYAGELAIQQQEEGADFLTVNAGLPDIDETEALPNLILAIQKVSPLPLVIDCSSGTALEKALRVYRGRPILNSVNGDPESMAMMLPLAAKYGAGLVVLALDAEGISDDAAKRRDTALYIAGEAEKAGVARNAIFIDCLAMAASVSGKAVMVTAEAIALVKKAGYKTILGVSNISHGLPGREAVNCTFLSAALGAGLNLAIINTASQRTMETLAAGKVLMGQDSGCEAYIARYQGADVSVSTDRQVTLESLIISGRKGETPAAVEALLHEKSAVEVINSHIIPALDVVGDRYERGTLFLPQLMASAEAVKAAFSVIDACMPAGGGDKKGTIILATVKGDVHDIGKNIVKMLLENYGYEIIDLGRDVGPETVVEAALRTGAPLVGLSSLMTTTAQNIAVTIKALRAAGVACKVMVGGAVVTQEFADLIGADYYTKDAAQSAKVAGEVFG
ncbi:MAG: homocysteine S-methyltransferase family protein, partial [Clostridium sp.]|nr:homocysteine S-methyltransferase family protein [Clostridium sp.]